MKRDLEALKEENEILSRLASHDWLTGIYNRGATETKINQLLAEKKTGVLFVLDVDHFKQINDRYGHITGDSVIQEVVRILSLMTFKNDILGRVGGDEFVIYMPLAQDQSFADERCRQIRTRLLGIQMTSPLINGISVTVCGSLYQPGDDYKSLFDRADQLLLAEKRKKNKKPALTAAEERRSAAKKGIDIDMALIRSELSEQELTSGAYCQDYETFKSIYRFVERRLRRSGESAYIILFTLTDKNGDFPMLQTRELQMDTLKSVTQHSLRLGDVFTQYSSCQYLVMVSDVDNQNAELIAGRISETFYAETAAIEDKLLLHHCYPLKPAGTN